MHLWKSEEPNIEVICMDLWHSREQNVSFLIWRSVGV